MRLQAQFKSCMHTYSEIYFRRFRYWLHVFDDYVKRQKATGNNFPFHFRINLNSPILKMPNHSYDQLSKLKLTKIYRSVIKKSLPCYLFPLQIIYFKSKRKLMNYR